jgi:hypothetical protein
MAKRIEVALKSRDHGKLVRACVVVEGDRASAVTFTGDFFLEPPEVLEELSQAMGGSTAADVKERARSFFARRSQDNVMLIGAGPEDFVRVLEKAFQEAGRPVS